MARAATAAELASFRSDGQYSRLRLAIIKPAPVFQAQVNQAFTTADKITEITYNNVTAGAYADIIDGMTVWIGSTSGAQDIGRARIRKAATSAKIYIGEESELDLENDQYITVVAEFGLWPRHIYVAATGTAYMDYDLAYSDQHNTMNPVPVMGPHAVAEYDGTLGGANTIDTEWDASDSWVLGSTISGYSWSAPGGNITDGSTATPTISFDAPGTYLVSCTVTAANGKTTTGYRYARIFDNTDTPITQFSLGRCEGSIDAGGWEFEVTLHDDADIDDVYDQALVILFGRDFYGNDESHTGDRDEISIGPIVDRENIIAIGWIAEETLAINPSEGAARFDVRGPQAWLKSMTGFPGGQFNSTSAPAAWTDFEDLTVDKALFNFIYWRSTAAIAIDCRKTGDTRLAALLEYGTGDLWSQMVELTTPTILAAPACDRYGRLFVEIDTQFLAIASRSGIPTVMTLTKLDREQAVDVERITTPDVSQISISGVSYDGLTGAAIFSLAPGHVFKHFGRIEAMDRLLMEDQTGANTLAAAIIARRNNEWPYWRMNLQQNNRLIDITPRQYLAASLDETENPRGVSFSGNLIPRVVTLDHDAKTRMLSTSIEAEAETIPGLSVTGTIPDSPPPPSYPPLPGMPDLPAFPSWPGRPGTQIRYVVILDDTEGIWFTDEFDELSPRWWSMNGGLTAAQRAALNEVHISRTGKIYSLNTALGVYYGAVGKGTLQIRYGAAWLAAQMVAAGQNPANPDKFWTIGLRSQTDTIALLAGKNVLYDSVIYPFYGTINSLVRKTTTTEIDRGASLTYGGNKWIATGTEGFGFDRKLTRWTYNFGTREAFSSLGAGGTLTYYHHARAGITAKLYAFGADICDYTDDNGVFITDKAPSGFTLNQGRKNLGCDPTGQYLMAQTSAATKRSSDYAATWGAISSLAAGTWSFICAANKDRWVAASGVGVMYTDDFGDSWTDKTGNLLDFIPSPVILDMAILTG